MERPPHHASRDLAAGSSQGRESSPRAASGRRSPIAEFGRGFRAYPRGLRWLSQHRRWFFLLLVPITVGLVAFATIVSLFFTHQDAVFSVLLFAQPEAWWMLALWYVARFFLTVAIVILGALTGLVVVSIVAAPLYEMVSVAVERDFTGELVHEMTFLQSIGLIGEEVKKALFILIFPILFLLVPGLNVLSSVIAAFLIGWDFSDYPLARRGMAFRERLSFVTAEGWAVLGFGIWLVLPVVQIILMPLAIPGGTLLNLEALERRGLVQRSAQFRF